MELVKFINTEPHWREILAKPPYNITLKDDGDYTLLKYDMITSDMTLEIVKECRGTIIRKDSNTYRVVCYPFRKFANYGESYADTNLIDFSRVSVLEKVDGSLFKFFYDQGQWRLATNNTINAFMAPCGDSTFGDVFYSIVRANTTIEAFLSCMKPNRTYFFEMVHPFYNPIVIHYSEPAIYFIGCRDMDTLEEVRMDDGLACEFDDMEWIRRPRLFPQKSLYECIAAAHNMNDDEEGYVVVSYGQRINGSFLRIKVKGDKYLELHRLRGNGPVTPTKIISLWQSDLLDDFLAYFPENATLVNGVVDKLRVLCEMADIGYDAVKESGKRRDFALRAQSYIKPIQSYMFARLDNKVDCAQTYFKQMKAKNLADLLNVKEISLK